MLKTENLAINIHGKEILSGINIDIAEGKRTAIIGPNGCGKSTLLKAISGLNHNYEGRITLDGQDIKKLSRRKIAQKLAILPQGAAAPSDLTVKDLVAYGRFPYRSMFGRNDGKKDQAVIAEAMAKTKISHLANRLVSTLSGGERQRTWIAMALAQQPRILLLDEPTTYLDIAHQLEVMQIITDLNIKEKMTIVMVLHDINHARMYADDVIIIKDHHVFAHGTPREILDEKNLAEVFGVKADMYQNCNDPNDKIIFPRSLTK